MTKRSRIRVQFRAVMRKSASLILIGCFAGSFATIATQQVLAESAAENSRIIPIPKKITIEKGAPMPGLPDKAVVIGGAVEAYSAGGGSFQVGVWEGTAGTVHIDDYPADEFWFLASGSITFTNESGYSQTFRAGDTFVLPKGYRGVAVMPRTLRKHYVSFSGSGA